MTRRELREQLKVTVSTEATPERDGDFADPLTGTTDLPRASAEDQAQRDAFAQAAAALNFGDAPGRQRAEARAERQNESRTKKRDVATPQRTLNTPFRKFAAATASLGALAAVGLIVFGATLPPASPALADAASSDVAATLEASAPLAGAPGEQQLQGYVAGANVKSEPLERVKGYEASTFSELAQVSGISTSNAVFDNDPTADIQWPFAVGTSMSSPFGFRWGRLHEGVDFTPGDGAPVQAIADGIVRTASEAGGAYGVNVYIDHVIDGEIVTSHYAHMQYGSLQVSSGQRVEVGDMIGRTGNTGRSYGAHLHFEIRYNDTPVDPLPWLQAHANTHYTDDEEALAEQQEQDLLGLQPAE